MIRVKLVPERHSYYLRVSWVLLNKVENLTRTKQKEPDFHKSLNSAIVTNGSSPRLPNQDLAGALGITTTSLLV